jgi:hypothetical protein
VTGLRVTPYLSPDSKTGVAPFDCRTCPDDGDANTRRCQHCGHLDPSRWAPGPAPVLAEGLDLNLDEHGQPVTSWVCPGYLARLPAVIEGGHATMAFRSGELSTFYPDPPAPLIDAVSILSSAFNQYEADQIKKQSAQGPTNG